MPKTRRVQVTSNAAPLLITWARSGLTELAGYVAWLVADSYEAEGNESRAAKVIDIAVQCGASDPRVTMSHARRLAAQRRDTEVRAVVKAALARRTTDPGFDELEGWMARYRARKSCRPRGPAPKPGTSVRVARPEGRVRAGRFSI